MTRGGQFEANLREGRDARRKLLVAYVTAGMVPEWVEVVHALAAAGADAIEIGIPFSDPMIDGPTIQRASSMALEAGTTPSKVLDSLGRETFGVPLAVMTYYNLVFRAGHRRFAGSLAEAGVGAAILPDLSLEESGPWCEEEDRAGIDTVMLEAPSTPDERAARICSRARGFVYAVGVMGVTGERSALALSAHSLAVRLRPLTDLPICIGIGISSASQAAEACAHADGVVVGSALVRRLIDGAGPAGAAEFFGELRVAVDAAAASGL